MEARPVEGSETDPGSLQIEEDLRFHRRDWVAQRVGQVALLALIAAAVLGLTSGSGPFSGARAVDGRGLQVHYERTPAYLALHTLTVTLPRSAGDATALSFNRSYLDSFAVDAIEPEPENASSTSTRRIFTFAHPPATPSVITFTLRPLRRGVHAADVRTDSGGEVRFRQFVYP